MKRIILSITILVCFIANIAFANYAFAQTPKQKLQKLLQQVQTIQAQFKQTVRSEDLRVLQKSTGNLAMVRPGYFRWYTSQPNRQLIVADGRKVWMYDYNLAQVTVNPQKEKLAHSPALLLAGYDKGLLKNYNVKQVKTQYVGQKTFLLTPKDKNDPFKAIFIVFRHRLLSQMRLNDRLGQVTDLEFSHIVINKRINPSLFRFVPPKNVDVI